GTSISRGHGRRSNGGRIGTQKGGGRLYSDGGMTPDPFFLPFFFPFFFLRTFAPGPPARADAAFPPPPKVEALSGGLPAARRPLEHGPAGRVRRQVSQQGLQLLGPDTTGRRTESLVQPAALGGEFDPRDGLLVGRRPLLGALAGRPVAVEPQPARALERDHDQVAVAFPAKAQESQESHVCLRRRPGSTGRASRYTR